MDNTPKSIAQQATISAAPEPGGLDHRRLLEEGLACVERWAGAVRHQLGDGAGDHHCAERAPLPAWTDYNAHDPGITLLEQLCYLIQDLCYRLDFPLEDLLAPPPGAASGAAGAFPTARQVLTSDPLTVDDLRRVALDVPGVGNAWVEPLRHPRPALFHDAARRRLSGDPANGERVALGGLYRVLLQREEAAGGADALQAAVLARLRGVRNLGEDFAEVRVLPVEAVKLRVRVELASPIDPAGQAARIHDTLARHVAPTLRFYTLEEMLRSGRPVEEIFAGPALRHGFLRARDLEAMTRRRVLRCSDLVHLLMDLDGVRAVPALALTSAQAPLRYRLSAAPLGALVLDPVTRAKLQSLVGVTFASRARLSDALAQELGIDDEGIVQAVLGCPEFQLWEPWSLELSRDHAPRLQGLEELREGGGIELLHGGAPLRVNPGAAAAALAALDATRPPARRGDLAELDLDLAPPRGRFRAPGSYRSVQHELPPVYGVGQVGLPASASPCRHVQARQLQGYLLLFDQLLADLHNQLAHAGDLLSPGGSDPARSYFPVDLSAGDRAEEAVPGVGALLAGDAAAAVEEPGAARERRSRLLDHLLARHAEGFPAPGRLELDSDEAQEVRWLGAKAAFLRSCPDLGGARGRGVDLTALPASSEADAEAASGLKARLYQLLAIDPQAGEGFHLVEHILLRPGSDPRELDFTRPLSSLTLEGADLVCTSPDHGLVSGDRVQLLLEGVSPSVRRVTGFATETFRVCPRHCYRLEEGDLEALDVAALDPLRGRTFDDEEDFLYVLGMTLGVRETELRRSLLLQHGRKPVALPESTAGRWVRADCPVDPYSFQVSAVLPASAGRFGEPEFCETVEELLLAEVPAHLTLHICWLGPGPLVAFRQVHTDWLEARHGGEDRAAVAVELLRQLRVF